MRLHPLSERLSDDGLEPSVGCRRDSHANALAETITGLIEAELIHRRALWRICDSVEIAMLEWVAS